VKFLIVPGSLIALLTLPGTIELLLLSVAGWMPRRRSAPPATARYRLGIVVPSHNEELNIAGCLKSLLAADRNNIDLTVAVIADNCTDRTAEVAAAAGARVLVRNNKEKRGKGFALDHAFNILMPEGFDGFAVIDADSAVSPNLLTATVAELSAGADATQCRYIVRNSGDSVRTRLLSLALLAFNVLRPRGRDRLGLSCGIYGNGFALAAATLREVPYTAESVVEDLEFHLALVRAGKRVRFIDYAVVSGDMPAAGAGVKTQRARWEGGRFRMMAEKLPSLTGEILRGKFALTEPCLDLALLPLAFHVVLLILAALTPFWFARDLGLFGLAVIVFHLVAAIGAGGGTWRDVAVLAAAPFYILWKLMLIPRLLATSRSGAAWVRTERPGETKRP
jgi:cellulose synthase/poly-beta-1,6-N-acetylglucosamine synthase-like glycosyltransferase